MKLPLNAENATEQAAAKHADDYRLACRNHLENRYLQEGIDGPLARALLEGSSAPTYETIGANFLGALATAQQFGVSWSVAHKVYAEELKRLSAVIHKATLELALTREKISLLYPFAVVRQEAVGHGGFHTGALGFAYPQFRWVYDCGSWHKRDALERRISDFLDRARRYGARYDIDLLFLSHFDADHVNGLEVLLAGRDGIPTTVDTVVAPYLDPIDRFATLGRAVARDQCPPDLVEAVARPEDFFGNRGVRRLILVKPDDDAGKPSGDDAKSPVPPRPVVPRDKGNPFAVDAIIASGQFLTEEQTIKQKIVLCIVEPGLMFEASSEKRWLDWIFLPHAYRWHFNRALLATQVRKTVGLAPDDPDFCQALVRLLRTKKGLQEVKKIYCGMDSNSTSLSLYAGPGYRNVERRSFKGKEPVGWLLTGDAPLNRKDAFGEWKEAYTSLSKNVGRLMLPHHGALRNFNKGLFDFAESAIPFLTVDQKDFDDEKRPPAAVRRHIPRAFKAVTERSGITEISGEPSAGGVWEGVRRW